MSCGVPDVVNLLGVSICNISLPIISKNLSIVKPAVLSNIPLTPSLTLCTAISES